jgi:subtilisin family serine protease
MIKQKLLHFILYLICPIFLIAQPEKALNDFDFIIEPIREKAVFPNEYALNAGNWAQSFHEIDQFTEHLDTAATKPVIVFFYGTAARFEHPFLNDIARNDLGGIFTGELSVEDPDKNGHETHVAGCAFAYSNHLPLGTGAILHKKRLVIIVPMRTALDNGGGRYSWINEALEDGFTKGVEYQLKGWGVIHNISSGGSGYDDELAGTIKKIADNGQFVLCSAGNTGNEPILFPASAPDAIAVAAIDQAGKRAYFSSVGKVFAAAAGVGILSTIPPNQLVKYDGTSMASPSLAGIFAIIISTNPGATYNQTLRFYVKHASNNKWNNQTGWGFFKMSQYVGNKATDELDDPIGIGDDEGEDPELKREYRELTLVFRDKKNLVETVRRQVLPIKFT